MKVRQATANNEKNNGGKRMVNGDLREVYNAIETYYADDGVVEIYGIMYAFLRSIEAKETIFVLTETIEHDGESYNVFTMLNDEDDHEVFPLFTDFSEMSRVKAELESTTERLNVGIMDLGYVLKFLVERQLCDGIAVNPISQNFSAPLAFYNELLRRQLVSHVTLIQADITDLHTDAIVCPTDENFSGTSGVDAAVQSACGEELQNEIAGEKLNIADVAATENVGDLHCKYVFFTRGPIRSENIDHHAALYDCYYNCMNVAKQAGCTSIAFPNISAGVNGVPFEMVMDAATRAVTTWLGENSDYAIDVYFCSYEDGDKERYQSFFDSLAKR